MAYTPTTWTTGDTVTAALLNKAEQGIESASTFVCSVQFGEGTMTLSKTWQEICDALSAGAYAIAVVDMSEGGAVDITHARIEGIQNYDGYTVSATNMGQNITFSCNSANGYPSATMGG